MTSHKENGAAKLFSDLQLSGGCASFEVSTKINRNLHMNSRTFFGGAPFFAVLIGGLTAFGTETSVVPEPGDLRTAGTVEGFNLRDGAMGNCHDVVASDLDTSDSRRNERW